MIEGNKTYDLLPGIDLQAYSESAKKWIGTLLQATGFVEFRAHRNLSSSPQVRSTFVWETLADWARFAESAERQELESELRTFAADIKIEIWGPSPVVPEPIRPGK